MDMDDVTVMPKRPVVQKQSFCKVNTAYGKTCDICSKTWSKLWDGDFGDKNQPGMVYKPCAKKAPPIWGKVKNIWILDKIGRKSPKISKNRLFGPTRLFRSLE